MHSLVRPIHLDHQDLLNYHVDHPWSTYCPQVIGMMDIVVAAVARDVVHDVEHTHREDPLVLVLLRRIDSMHHC